MAFSPVLRPYSLLHVRRITRALNRGSNTWFLEPTRVSRPKAVSISSAVFAQLTCGVHNTQILVEIALFEREVGHFERKFHVERGAPTNNFWHQKSRVPGLSYGEKKLPKSSTA